MSQKSVDKYPLLLVEVPDHLNTQEMCKEVVRIEPIFLAFVADCFKTEEM